MSKNVDVVLNEEIDFPEIRCVGDDGEQYGLISSDEALKIATKHKSLGRLVNEYGDTAIRLINKYGEKAVIGLNVIDASKTTMEVVSTARKVVTMCPVPLEEGLLQFLLKYTDNAVSLLAKHNLQVVELFQKVGLRNQDLLVKILCFTF